MRQLSLTILMAVGVSVAAHSAAPLDRSVLPIPTPAFGGQVGKDYKASKTDFPQPVTAPAGAPNVVVILLDDVGFGQASTFGGPVPTPALDRLARRGVTYNRFHTTGICSPTRAALLTGRNHHQVGFGTITELSTGFPSYNTIWRPATASIARVLKDNGYATGAFGKWHNTPDWETSPAGPFERWPTGLGFETFYGFHGGETSQWEPQLYRDTRAVEPATRPEQGYHLNQDLVDTTITWINEQRSINPNKPYFAYFAPGAVHAPLHAPKAWIDKFKGQFDQGWDQSRIETLERQKKMGLVPANTQLTERPAEIAAWNSLSADEKRLFARHMEVFAGFLAYTDAEIGRLLDAIEKRPDGGNTLIMYIVGDNGASAEGGIAGTTNNIMTQHAIPDSVPSQLKLIDELGGHKHENHYPVGWSWAGSSPFKWMKRVPSHFGGTRNGLVIAWPDRIKNVGGLRTQFHHVVDVTPTILEAARLPAPKSVDGVPQIPMAGTSMGYSFEQPKAKDQRTIQYFEVGGHRAIYKDGWVAATRHGVPWVLRGSTPFDQDVWELYNIESDFSQAVDLATQRPDKLKELQAAFDAEATKNEVYPLDDRFIERAFNRERPSSTMGRTSFSYGQGTVRIPEGSAPSIYQRNHRIDAMVDIAADGKTEGVIVACGGSSGGYTFFVDGGQLVYEYNFFNKARFRVTSNEKLTAGKHKVSMVYEQLPFQFLREVTGGPVKLYIDDRLVAEGKVDSVVPVRFSATETMDVGMDLGSTVATTYEARAPFKFTGRIDKVDFTIAPTQPLKTN